MIDVIKNRLEFLREILDKVPYDKGIDMRDVQSRCKI